MKLFTSNHMMKRKLLLLLSIAVVGSINCSRNISSKTTSNDIRSSDLDYHNNFSLNSISPVEDVVEVFNFNNQILSVNRFDSGVANDLYGKLLMSPYASELENMERLYEFHVFVSQRLKNLFFETPGSLSNYYQQELDLSSYISEVDNSSKNEISHARKENSYKKLNDIIETCRKSRDLKELKTTWRRDRIEYRNNLELLLNNETDLYGILRLPTFVALYLINENPNNLKRDYGGRAKSEIGLALKNYLERIDVAYSRREAQFNSILNSSIYAIAFFSGKSAVNKNGKEVSFLKSSNIKSIRNFSNEPIILEWNDINRSDKNLLIHNDSYVMLNKWIPLIQNLSISRDIYYTLTLLTQNFFIVSGFDSVF